MEFIGVKELSQSASAVVNKKDWVVITKNGKPVKLMIDIDAQDLEELLLAKHLDLVSDLKEAMSDAKSGQLPTLQQVLASKRPPRK